MSPTTGNNAPRLRSVPSLALRVGVSWVWLGHTRHALLVQLAMETARQ